jgi:hypothetical protein
MGLFKNTIINDTGSLTIPVGTTGQRAVSPVAGHTRFNTTIGAVETYNGSAWIPMIKETADTNVPSQTLSEAVGVQPILHYSGQDLEAYADSTTLNTSAYWKNRGVYGARYDLLNDNRGSYTSNVTKVTQFARAAANFSGNCGLAFREAGPITLTAASATPNFTVAYVYGGGTSSTAGDSSPVFTGSTGTTAYPPPDNVGGGLFGWHASSSFGTHQTWYDNDGYVPLGTSSLVTNNSDPNMWIHRVSSGSGTSICGRIGNPFFGPTTWTGGSIGAGPTYGFSLLVTGLGHVRRTGTGETITGYVYEAILWDTALSNEQIENLRNYFIEKYPMFPNFII